MSLGYAEKLSFIEDVGNVGMAEFFDPSHVFQEKVKIFLGVSLFYFVFWLHCSYCDAFSVLVDEFFLLS